MKNTTVINGVTLTRAQVEAALEDLNKAEPISTKPGMRVQSNYSKKAFRVLSQDYLDVIATNIQKHPNAVLLLDEKTSSLCWEASGLHSSHYDVL